MNKRMGCSEARQCAFRACCEVDLDTNVNAAILKTVHTLSITRYRLSIAPVLSEYSNNNSNAHSRVLPNGGPCSSVSPPMLGFGGSGPGISRV